MFSREGSSKVVIYFSPIRCPAKLCLLNTVVYGIRKYLENVVSIILFSELRILGSEFQTVPIR